MGRIGGEWERMGEMMSRKVGAGEDEELRNSCKNVVSRGEVRRREVS